MKYKLTRKCKNAFSQKFCIFPKLCILKEIERLVENTERSAQNERHSHLKENSRPFCLFLRERASAGSHCDARLRRRTTAVKTERSEASGTPSGFRFEERRGEERERRPNFSFI